MKTPEFDRFIAVDWSGARGKNLIGIKIAEAKAGDGSPNLIRPAKASNWSREGVVQWLNQKAKSSNILVGFDFSFSSPFLDQDCYFPEMEFGARSAKTLWRDVEAICKDDPDLYAGSLVADPDFAPYFLTAKERGDKFKRRFRKTEAECREKGFGRAESMFHLIGPSQVGLGSFSGMRALIRLKGFSIWPFDQNLDGSVAVEIYTRLFLTNAQAGHKKIKSIKHLNIALTHLKSEGLDNSSTMDDHETDALVSAAGLRAIHNDPKAWSPEGLLDYVIETEGWTFGVK